MFRLNEVLGFNEQLYRVLAVFPEEVVWFPLEDSSAFPTYMKKAELVSAITDTLLTRVEDPYAYIAFETPEKTSTAYTKREKNFSLISPIIADEAVFDRKVRAKRIKRVIDETGTTKRNLYKLLKRYWARGQAPNALLPDYKNSGAAGKKRDNVGKKLGRPRDFTPGTGAIIDQDVERLFRQAIEKNYLTKKQETFRFTYRKFKTVFKNLYNDIPEEEIPSFWQMRHFYRREYQQHESIEKRTPNIHFNKDIRPLHSTANTQVLGPGSRFEIDATIGDIYLVSNRDRSAIVGRPTIFLVIDVFSRMIAGVYIGLENPSYATAMQALINAMTSKVEFCQHYGINIEAEDWPAEGLPDALLADKGELWGHQIESLEKSFNVRVENAPAYRGDAKGIVERYFRTIQANFSSAPGAVTDTIVKKRGGNDYRFDATLNLKEFTEVILRSIIYHNRDHTLEKYDRCEDMPADLELIPNSLWNWGLQNRTGKLRQASITSLTVALLPRETATISNLGIKLFGLYYTSQELVKRGWLHRTKDINRPTSFEAAYDPRSLDVIYIFPEEENSQFWACDLAPRSREFSGCTFWDVKLITNQQKQTLAKCKLTSDEKKRELEEDINRIIKGAEKAAKDKDSHPDVERIKNIKWNRDQAKRQERKISVAKHGKTRHEEPAKVVPFKKEQDYRLPDLVDELFDEDDF